MSSRARTSSRNNTLDSRLALSRTKIRPLPLPSLRREMVRRRGGRTRRTNTDIY
jgi:hypothetical protein